MKIRLYDCGSGSVATPRESSDPQTCTRWTIHLSALTWPEVRTITDRMSRGDVVTDQLLVPYAHLSGQGGWSEAPTGDADEDLALHVHFDHPPLPGEAVEEAAQHIVNVIVPGLAIWDVTTAGDWTIPPIFRRLAPAAASSRPHSSSVNARRTRRRSASMFRSRFRLANGLRGAMSAATIHRPQAPSVTE